MKRTSILVALCLLLVLAVGWMFWPNLVPSSTPAGRHYPDIPSEVAAARQALEQRGYRIVAYDGTIDEYQLTQDKLVEMPYMIDWGLQPDDPTPYIGKTIRVLKFRVLGHPLNHWIGQTVVSMFLVEHQPVGGVAAPVTVIPAGGGPWSLEGRTLEEVHDIDFLTWRQRWMEKFK